MNTRKAIEWLEGLKKIHDRGIFNIKQNANEIIELLQDNEYLGRVLMCPKDFYKRSEYIDKLKRGEKFEQMWVEFKETNPPAVINYVKTHDDVSDIIKQSKILRNTLMDTLEQKHFPKKEEK